MNLSNRWRDCRLCLMIVRLLFPAAFFFSNKPCAFISFVWLVCQVMSLFWPVLCWIQGELAQRVLQRNSLFICLIILNFLLSWNLNCIFKASFLSLKFYSIIKSNFSLKKKKSLFLFWLDASVTLKPTCSQVKATRSAAANSDRGWELIPHQINIPVCGSVSPSAQQSPNHSPVK